MAYRNHQNLPAKRADLVILQLVKLKKQTIKDSHVIIIHFCLWLSTGPRCFTESMPTHTLGYVSIYFITNSSQKAGKLEKEPLRILKKGKINWEMLHILFLNEHSWLNNCEETFKSPSNSLLQLNMWSLIISAGVAWLWSQGTRDTLHSCHQHSRASGPCFTWTE